MKRSPRFRKEHKVIANYHTSKNWRYPEQCPAHFREPLEEIDTGLRTTCKWNFEFGYVSPMIKENIEKFFSSYFNNRPAYMAVFSRDYRDVYCYKSTYMKRNADRRDSRNGIDEDYLQTAKDYMYQDGEFAYDDSYEDEQYYYDMLEEEYNEDTYFNNVIKPMLKRDYKEKTIDEAWQYYFETSVLDDWDTQRPIAQQYRKHVEIEMGFNSIKNKSENEDKDKLYLCPEDGRFVENAA